MDKEGFSILADAFRNKEIKEGQPSGEKRKLEQGGSTDIFKMAEEVRVVKWNVREPRISTGDYDFVYTLIRYKGKTFELLHISNYSSQGKELSDPKGQKLEMIPIGQTSLIVRYIEETRER